MSSQSRGALVVIAISATVLALVPVALAHRHYYKSTVSIQLTPVPNADVASGKVDSDRKACRKGRTILLFEEGKPGITGEFLEIGRTTTDDSGNWSVPIQNGIKKGRAYHAEAKAKTFRNGNGHKHICKSKLSPDVIGG